MFTASGRDPVIVKVPIYSTADIADGALIMPGVTAETDLGLFIQAATTGVRSLGTLRGKHAHATTNRALANGTQWVEAEVELNDQYSPIWVEYDQTDTADVASTSTTTVTITSLEDNIDTSWLYATAGTGKGKLAYLATSASGSAVSKTATGWDSSTDVIKILRLGHLVAKLNSAATKIGTDAAAGSWTVFILENWFEAEGYELQRLNPTKHDNLTLKDARFYAKLFARNTAGHTTS